MDKLILLLKSHVAGYMRAGRYVKPHERKGLPGVSIGPDQLALFSKPATPAKPNPFRGKDPVASTGELFGHDAPHGKLGPLFHGSAVTFERYDPARSGKGGGYRHQGDGVYLTSDEKGYARFFARAASSKMAFSGPTQGTMSQAEADELEDSEGVIAPARLDPGAKILDLREDSVPADVKGLFDRSVGHPEIGKQLSARVRELGYDGIAFVEPNAPEGWETQRDATTVVVYNHDKVQFDTKAAKQGRRLRT